jgi:hypothetical protein
MNREREERRKKVGTWKWGYAFVVAGYEGLRKLSAYLFFFFKKQQKHRTSLQTQT